MKPVTPPANAIPLSAGNTIQGLAGSNTAITYTILGVEYSVDGEPDYKVLAHGVLATANATLYTAPTRVLAFVTGIQLVNTTTSEVTGVVVSINGSAAANKILPGASIPAKGTASLADGKWTVLDPSGNVYLDGAPALSDTAAGNTTPLAAGSAGAAETAARTDHTHRSPGGVAAIVAASAAIVNVETRIVGATIPADLLLQGTTLRLTAIGKLTTLETPGNVTFRVRIGAETLTGNIAASVVGAAVASITAQPFAVSFLVTVRTIGASGTIVGQGVLLSENATTGAFTVPNKIGYLATPVAVDTTAELVVEMTVVTGATDAAATLQNAAIEIVKQ